MLALARHDMPWHVSWWARWNLGFTVLQQTSQPRAPVWRFPNAMWCSAERGLSSAEPSTRFPDSSRRGPLRCDLATRVQCADDACGTRLNARTDTEEYRCFRESSTPVLPGLGHIKTSLSPAYSYIHIVIFGLQLYTLYQCSSTGAQRNHVGASQWFRWRPV